MITIDYQVECQITRDESLDATESLPSLKQLEEWVTATLAQQTFREDKQTAELSIRVVELTESQNLNHQYRHIDKPTNVLSFPADIPEYIDIPLLGDLVICADIVIQEAKEQNKALMAHWAHMVVHGTLHLIGYDHIDDNDAEVMETLESQILVHLGFPAPYESPVNTA